jgi:type III restriction enzyme
VDPGRGAGQGGQERHLEDSGHLELFRNYNEHGVRLARPNTLLIDSAQLESGEALDKEFRAMAGPEIDQFKREMLTAGPRRRRSRISPMPSCCARS